MTPVRAPVRTTPRSGASRVRPRRRRPLFTRSCLRRRMRRWHSGRALLSTPERCPATRSPALTWESAERQRHFRNQRQLSRHAGKWSTVQWRCYLADRNSFHCIHWHSPRHQECRPDNESADHWDVFLNCRRGQLHDLRSRWMRVRGAGHDGVQNHRYQRRLQLWWSGAQFTNAGVSPTSRSPNLLREPPQTFIAPIHYANASWNTSAVQRSGR